MVWDPQTSMKIQYTVSVDDLIETHFLYALQKGALLRHIGKGVFVGGFVFFFAWTLRGRVAGQTLLLPVTVAVLSVILWIARYRQIVKHGIRRDFAWKFDLNSSWLSTYEITDMGLATSSSDMTTTFHWPSIARIAANDMGLSVWTKEAQSLIFIPARAFRNRDELMKWAHEIKLRSGVSRIDEE